ncbi:MAG: excinuclease ABC subunit UvrA [Bacteroidales bacterium]|nr:excinuclease ABC subunit UvrA [Bacteroidales bacterium]
MTSGIENLDPHEFIIIKGAHIHNLKNIDVAIPRNKLVVITGLSGSGKSSLAFDTLYAEGQRRYVESLSSYARQFLGRMSKPEVDYIKGIAPAIAIEQKVNTRNPRSTVGTSSEIYEYLKLLYARIGQTFSPISGEVVKRETVSDVTDFIQSLPEGCRVLIMAPFIPIEGRPLDEHLSVLLQQGFTRIWTHGEIVRIDELTKEKTAFAKKSGIHLIIDRLADIEDNEMFIARIADSVQTAFYEGRGSCIIEFDNGKEKRMRTFSNRFEADGIQFEEPSVNLFTFNNPYGACKTCEGFGSVIGIDEDLVIPDKSLSIYDEGVACWKGEKLGEWRSDFIHQGRKIDFPIHRSYCDLSEEEKEILWEGKADLKGIRDFFRMVEENAYKIQYRVIMSRYRGKTTCPDCKGTRLRKDAGYVKIHNKSLIDIVNMPLLKLKEYFDQLSLSDHDFKVARRLLTEINNRVGVLIDVGLGYLSLNRLSNSLSGGESQRLNLGTALGSSLVGSMYILDEPSIGLHPRDTHRLIHVLKQLRDLGNTVIVVEHDEEIIKAADEIIDIGPFAGMKGGELVFQGNFSKLVSEGNSLTAKYIRGEMQVSVPHKVRKWKEYITIKGAAENNLKNIDVKFPMGVMCVVSGVSGSGKTTLVKRILYPALRKLTGTYSEKTGRYHKLEGSYRMFENVEMVDQNPIGRSSRSNPATYLGAYDEIRSLFADQPLSKVRGYKPGYFSFNIAGGRCEECEGDGKVKIEMQFMADIHLTCDVCKGKRFKEEVLDIRIDEKNIADILDLTIDEAISFFGNLSLKKEMGQKVVNRLMPLMDVGLGYLKVGQPSSTLSGGEAQRIKLAFFIGKGSADKNTLFIFDEPTTGLHFHDISKLLDAFRAYLDRGHSLIIIEHHPDIIRHADWVIDLGPEGGDDGGEIIFEGIPEDLKACEKSYTSHFL